MLNSYKKFIEKSDFEDECINEVLENLNTPPKLSSLWTFVGKITGNVEKPNINTKK